MRPPKKFVAEPFEYHQEIELTIDALSNQGTALGRVDGWVVFVPFALPGERVIAKIYRNDKNCSHGDLIRVLEPSPDRREPVCRLFGTCGGCQYQHVSYEKQLEWKSQQVAELLKHSVGVDFPVLPAIASPQQWNYRSKITPHFQKPRQDKIDAIGFLKDSRRQEVLDVPQCPIAMEEINAALPAIRKQVHANAKNYKKGATLLLRAAEGRVETNPSSVVTEQVGDLKFDFLAGEFFQNNPYILPAFTEYVAAEASADGCTNLVDAYCGSGLFAISLAKHFQHVAGVEVSEAATDWARHNARKNNIEHAKFLAASAEAIFKEIDFDPAHTTILIDPPRKGSSPEFLEQLIAFAPKRVVYVSCNPSTQIRDLEYFLTNGYKITKIQPFDLFPQTKHLECVATLEKV